MPSHLGHEWGSTTARTHNNQTLEGARLQRLPKKSILEGARLQSCHKTRIKDPYHSAEGRSEAAGGTTKLPSSKPAQRPTPKTLSSPQPLTQTRKPAPTLAISLQKTLRSYPLHFSIIESTAANPKAISGSSRRTPCLFTTHDSLLSPKPLCLQYPARNCFRSNIIRDAPAPEPHILNHLPPGYIEGGGGVPPLTGLPNSLHIHDNALMFVTGEKSK